MECAESVRGSELPNTEHQAGHIRPALPCQRAGCGMTKEKGLCTAVPGFIHFARRFLRGFGAVIVQEPKGNPPSEAARCNKPQAAELHPSLHRPRPGLPPPLSSQRLCRAGSRQALPSHPPLGCRAGSRQCAERAGLLGSTACALRARWNDPAGSQSVVAGPSFGTLKWFETSMPERPPPPTWATLTPSPGGRGRERQAFSVVAHKLWNPLVQEPLASGSPWGLGPLPPSQYSPCPPPQTVVVL